MKNKFETIIRHIIGADSDNRPLSEILIKDQFSEDENENIAIAKNLNAAFLILLSGESDPLYSRASQYLNNLENNPSWSNAASFYKNGLLLIGSEISKRYSEDESFNNDLDALFSWLSDPDKLNNRHKSVEKIQSLFFPEGIGLCEERKKKIKGLRNKRRISITRVNQSPVADPAGELLFTSNILLTVPPDSTDIDRLPFRNSLKRKLKNIAEEDQIYWYDHPVPIDISPVHNEVLYGLEGLDRALEFEKEIGTLKKDSKVICVLSVSVTHKGLQDIVKEYFEEELKKKKNIRHLDVYVFTEADTQKMVESILMPFAINSESSACLHDVIGVDGEYGRHYSFLKAVSAFWKVFIDPSIKGTFKIDLDQVFPQKELLEEGGASAFENLKTPLWGAEGVDDQGSRVELGMIAGALVNEDDIANSLFTPDVPFPEGEVKADQLIFFSALPQALSTEAEMMTRYNDGGLDGRKNCIQRIHVTGGTNGILIDSLRKHRPFTPTFIGRAEDQAYLLSVLFDGNGPKLRYVHKDGLIMRHDKDAFADDAIKVAATGKLIGDYIRILMFSYYVKVLPWSFDKVKSIIDPFTGCFVSRIPLTVVYLRFALKAASFFSESPEQKQQQGLDFIQGGIARLHQTIKYLTGEPNPLISQFQKEKHGWDLYYDLLEKAEAGIRDNEKGAVEIKHRALSLVQSCKINF